MAAAMSKSSLGVRSEPVSKGCTLGRPTLKQPTFDLGTTDNYIELKNLWIALNSTFKSYNIYDRGKKTIIKNCLARQGLQFVETLTLLEQETCNTVEGLFDILIKQQILLMTQQNHQIPSILQIK